MKREDVPLVYKMLVQMRMLADKLDESLKANDSKRSREIKLRILEMQKALEKII